MDEQNKEALKSVFEGILALSTNANKEAFESISKNPVVESAIEALKKGDTEGFQYCLLYGIDEFIDGILDSTLANSDAKFLFKHSAFVEQHFERLFNKIEGMACCADKSSTIMSALASRFTKDKPIHFNYDGEYTFHLPKLIFKTEAEILEFFNGIRGLYYGSPEAYLTALKNVANKAAAANSMIKQPELKYE